MRDWIAGAMTVLGTLLVLSGAAIIILRAWSGAKPAVAGDATDTELVPGAAVESPAVLTPQERGARSLLRLAPPDRLIAWGILLLVLAAIAAGAIGFELGASAAAR
jgi:hypothetical protein